MNDSTLQIAFRTAKQIGIVNTLPTCHSLAGFVRPEGNFRCCDYSPDGRYFGWASHECVNVADVSTGRLVAILPVANVFELDFSQLGSYLLTWQRPWKSEDGNAAENLKVWRISQNSTNGERNDIRENETELVAQFVQRAQSSWKIQYTDDEEICARMTSNTVTFYRPNDLSKAWKRLHEDDVADFALAPGASKCIAVFVPERKGYPAIVKIYGIEGKFEQAISQKSFHRGDKVQLKWNKEGQTLLVLAQTDVDKSNKSYYGETNLYVLSCKDNFNAHIILDKEGPIHDVSWSPNSLEFGVVYGYMPAKSSIFNQKAEAVFSFNLGPRNTIRFSPHGRFVLVAGFGNLAGSMDIFDLEKNYNKVASIQASNSSVCEWSPDGQYILTAVTSPRLRVDNGLSIWHVTGVMVYHEEIQELYQVNWRPLREELFDISNVLNMKPKAHPWAIEYMEKIKAKQSAGAYRPPGARGTITPLHFKREDEGGLPNDKLYGTGRNNFSVGGGNNGTGNRRKGKGGRQVGLACGGGGGGGGGGNGGADGVEEMGGQEDDATNTAGISKAALKNRKKREARKAKEAAGSGSGSRKSRGEVVNRGDGGRGKRGVEVLSGQGSGLTERNGHEGVAIVTTACVGKDGAGLESGARDGGSVNDKKIRGLLKKVRAIEGLKMKQAMGEVLEETQLLKMKREGEVREELAKLGYHEQV